MLFFWKNLSKKKRKEGLRNMPLYRYKTFKEAQEALWHSNPDKDYYKKVADLWNFAHALDTFFYPRGIFKFKTIEEANKQQTEVKLIHAKKKMRNKKWCKQ